MDIQTMKIFQAVAKHKSFSAAAHTLNYAQSNISTKMQQLESELQTPLFFRHNRGIALTAKGLQLSEYVDRILLLSEEAVSVMREDGIARGPLALGSMETTAAVYLPKLMAAYHQAYPLVKLSLTTGTTTDNLERVLSRELDAALVAGPIHHPELAQINFTTENLILVTEKAPETASFSWHDMQNRTLLVFPRGCSYRQRLEQLVQQEGIMAAQSIAFNSLGALLSAVCAGLGMSLLPASVINQYLSAGLMSSCAIPEAYSVIPTVLVYRKDHIPNTSFRAFLQMVGEDKALALS